MTTVKRNTKTSMRKYFSNESEEEEEEEEIFFGSCYLSFYLTCIPSTEREKLQSLCLHGHILSWCGSTRSII